MIPGYDRWPGEPSASYTIAAVHVHTLHTVSDFAKGVAISVLVRNRRMITIVR